MFTQSFVRVELKFVQVLFDVRACGRFLIFRSVIKTFLASQQISDIVELSDLPSFAMPDVQCVQVVKLRVKLRVK